MKMPVSFLSFCVLSLGGLAGVPCVAAFEFEPGVPAAQQEAMERDLRVLVELDSGAAAPSAGEAALAQLLDVETVSSRRLEQWLGARVKIITTDFDTRLETRQIAWPHAYPVSALPYVETWPEVEQVDDFCHASAAVAYKVMSNVGAAIYHRGKTEGSLLAANLPSGPIIVHSPRVGIVDIGEGLFHYLKQANPEKPEAMANSLMRLATYFHEGRHSDGNGPSLGFLHALCPEGHTLQKKNACDRNLNGPYTVGARILQVLTKRCASCTIAEKETLRLAALDSLDRVLPEALNTPRLTFLDQEAAEVTRELLLASDGSQIVSLQARLQVINDERIRLYRYPTEPVTEWDAHPEGTASP